MSTEHDVFDEKKEIAEALDCLRATYSKPDYDPGSSNNADELTDAALTASADALIKPFATAFRKCYAN
jgi:hypothetical protein